MPLIRSTPTFPTRPTRRSGGVKHFLTLDLYSKGKIDKAVACFNRNQNHNGVRMDPSTPATSSTATAVSTKDRSQSVVKGNASLKRPLRSSSSGSTHASSSLPLTPQPPPKKRGGPSFINSGMTLPSSIAPKSPSKTPKQLKKTMKTPVADKQQKPVVPQTPPRTRKSAASTGGLAEFTLPSGSRPRSNLAVDQGMDRQKPDLRSMLEEAIEEKNPRMSSIRRNNVVSELEELVHISSTMTSICYETVTNNLKIAGKHIIDGSRLSDSSFLQAKVTSLESDKEKMKKERVEWKETEKELKRKLTLSERTAQKEEQEKTRLQQQNAALQREVQQLKSQPARVQQRQPAVRGRALAPVSSTSATSSNSAITLSHDQAVGGHSMTTRAFNMMQMPRGSAVGISQVTGRADEVIHDLANVAGMENAMASVEVTAAMRPEMDEDGNVVQRSVRTRVEHLAITGDADVDELRRRGYRVVKVDDEEDDETDGNGVLIEEIE